MAAIDFDLYIRGVEVTDKRRRIIISAITVIDKALVSLVQKGCRFQQIVLEVPLGELKFTLVHYRNGQLVIEFADEKGKHQPRWWGATRAEFMPEYAVPVIFKHLSLIVEKVDEKFPNLGIRAQFDFFISQADG